MPSFLRPRRTYPMAVLAVLLLAAVLGGASFLLLRDRRATLHAATTAQGNMALGLERDILRNIDIYDLSLRAAASGLRFLDGATDTAVQNAILFDGSTAAQHFRPIVIADETGTVVRDAASPTPRLPSIAKAPFYEMHRAQADLGLLVLLITRSGIDGRPYLSMTRRVSRPDGSFAGTVSGGLDLAYFRDIFSHFAVPSGGAIALVGYDGRLVAGYPFREDKAGQDISGSGLVEHAMHGDMGSFEITSVVDSVTRVATVRRLGSLPFFLVVDTPSRAVYAEWRERALVTVCGLAGVVAASLLLFLALRRELVRRRTAEGKARASEARHRLLADNTSDVITRLDLDFTRTYASPACRAVFGHEPDEMLGGKPAATMHPDDGRAVYRAVRLLIAGNAEKTTVAYRTQHKQGHWVPVEATISLVRDPVTREPASLVCALRDVTERNRIEAQLRQAQRMEAVGQLTAGVAHDFNNMLQAQLGALELLADELGDQPRALELARLALNAGEHGAKLTHSLLSFSRQQHLAPLPIPLGTLFDGLQRMLCRTLGPQVALEVAVREGTPRPFADAAQLEAALLNLALNGRDAMPDGGRLCIEAAHGLAGEAPDGAPPVAVVLAVSDAGLGMSPEVLARACEPFFTTKGVGQGSGLGLSMVQGFVQQSGGAMRILSHPAQGTCVELWLPGAIEEKPVEESPSPVLATRGGGRVLLVDDVPEVLAITAELLEAGGHEVVQAAHGEEALLLLETERRFDLLVTDYMMPGIGGGELVRRARELFPDLPALVITGYADVEAMSGLPPHVRVVRKPLRGVVLTRLVSDMLEQDREAAAGSLPDW